MKARDYLLDFFNYIFILFVILFLFFYYFMGDKLPPIARWMHIILPLSYVIILFILKYRSKGRRKKRKEEDGELDVEEAHADIILYLSYRDKIIDEVIVFLLPTVIVWLSYTKGVIDLYTVLQSGTVFIILFLWHNYLFKKGG